MSASTPPVGDLEVLTEDDVTFDLVGELDMNTAGALLEATATVLDRPGDIVLNLTRLRFMDVSGLNAVLAVARSVDGIVVLRCPQPNVRRMLDILDVGVGAGIRIEG